MRRKVLRIGGGEVQNIREGGTSGANFSLAVN